MKLTYSPVRTLLFVYLILVLASGCRTDLAISGPTSTLDVAAVVGGPTLTREPIAPEQERTVGPSRLPPASPTAPATVTQVPAPSPRPKPEATATTTPVPPLLFAVIGDYGLASASEAAVAQMVKSWEPAFILTTGDNNYPSGAAETIDVNIGQYYHEYIAPYRGAYGRGADQNRFFPTLGNHDWLTDGAQPYLDYFTLPGNERYYEVVWEPVHLFALDSDFNEPDGMRPNSEQATWLEAELAASEQPWKIVFFHHAPYSSGRHGNFQPMQWPFALWGASAVLSGHDHTYERLEVEGIPYFVNGLGGSSIYGFLLPQEASQVRFNRDFGAMRVTATADEIVFEFVRLGGEVVDRFALQAGPEDG